VALRPRHPCVVAFAAVIAVRSEISEIAMLGRFQCRQDIDREMVDVAKAG